MSEAEQARGVAPRERLTRHQRELVARRLHKARGHDPHLASRLGDAYEVSPNRLRALRRRAERGEELSPKRGRPRISEEERGRVRALVEREREAQGDVGWRPVLAGIERREGKGTVSTMLVQEETKAAKARARARKRRAIERIRVSHEVLARDAVWAQDATHAGRTPSGEKVEAELATDRATTRTVIASAGPPSSGDDIVTLLDRAQAERGCLPFVLQTDGGGPNRSTIVESYLADHQVIHLLSRPHTPTDNPVAEAKNRELKEEAGIAAGARWHDSREAAQHLAPALWRIDNGRLRAQRGYKTAVELDREMPRAQDLVDRKAFYDAARSAMDAATLGLKDVLQIRKAQQDAVWRELEEHGLAVTRVGTPAQAPPVTTQKPGLGCRRGHPTWPRGQPT